MNKSPKLLDQVRDKLRVKHYAIRIEQNKGKLGLDSTWSSHLFLTIDSLFHSLVCRNILQVDRVSASNLEKSRLELGCHCVWSFIRRVLLFFLTMWPQEFFP
jgi:hypothetical protein